MSDLKPCPFCGSSDVGGASGIISCYRCPAEISVQNTNTHYAAELWNNRAALAQQAGSGEAVAKVRPASLLGLSAFEVKAIAQELHRAAHEHSDGDDDYPLDVQIIERVINDDNSVMEGPILCIRDSDYPEEGVYPIPNSQEVRDRYTHPSASVHEEAVRIARKWLSMTATEGGHLHYDDITKMAEALVTTPQPADNWIKCSERQSDAINHALDVLSRHGDAFTSVGAMKVLEEMVNPPAEGEEH